MTNKRELPKAMAVFQKHRWDGENYTGFRCHFGCNLCPFKKVDHLDDDEALKKIRGLYELHHLDGARKSKTGTSYPEQLVMLCEDCHTLLHANDPSASRLKW